MTTAAGDASGSCTSGGETEAGDDGAGIATAGGSVGRLQAMSATKQRVRTDEA